VGYRFIRLATLVAIVVAGCSYVSTSPPPVGPDDFVGITAKLAAARVSVAHVVSGESGCDDPELARTAIRFQASGLDQPEPATFYLYIFRNRAAFDRVKADVEVCRTAYVRDASATPAIEVSPYVLATPDALAPGFAAALAEALEEAAGTGG
jgi:hypothetical protein